MPGVRFTTSPRAFFATKVLSRVSLMWRAIPLIASSDRKSTRLNSSHLVISYAVFCLKKKKSTLSTVSSRSRRHRVRYLPAAQAHLHMRMCTHETRAHGDPTVAPDPVAHDSFVWLGRD